MNDGSKTKKGFTLIELIITIAIFGIIAGIGTIAFSTVQEKGRDAKRKDDLGKIKIALEAHHADNGGYPPMPSDGSAKTFTSDSGSDPWIDGLTSDYIKNLPKDPKTAMSYRYDVPANRQTFILWAQLENTNDREIYSKSTATCRETPPAVTSFNYCVQNP